MRGLVALLAASLAGCASPALVESASAGLDALACPAPCALPVGDGVGRAWEPSVAVDPTDPRHVVVGHAVWGVAPETGLATSWLTSHASFDGGATWTTTRIPGGPRAGASHPLLRATAMGDAMVAFLPDGTLLYAGLAFQHAGAGPRTDLYASARTGYDLFVARSMDGGLTFPEVSIVRRGGGALAFAVTPAAPVVAGGYAAWDANDKEWLAVGPDGTVLLAWSRILAVHPEEPSLGRHDVVASVSTDGGRAWTAPALVEKGGDFLGASPAIAEDGGMHVAYVDLFTHDLRVATSRDGGRTWSARSLGQSASFPSLAARDGRLVLAFAHPLEDAPHVLAQDQKRQEPAVAWSTDGGATWREPLVLDAAEAPGRLTPQVVVPRGGAPIVTWFHALAEGAEYRAARVGEAGASAPLALDAPRAPARLLGDYQGLAATPDGGAVAAWVTSEDGEMFLPRLAVLAGVQG